MTLAIRICGLGLMVGGIVAVGSCSAPRSASGPGLDERQEVHVDACRALDAAWERVLEASAPESSHQRRIDQTTAKQMLELIEAVSGLTPPEQWADDWMAMEFRSDGSETMLVTPTPKDEVGDGDVIPLHAPETNPLYPPDALEIQLGSERFVIRCPTECGACDRWAIAADDELACIALHTGWPFPYNVFAIQRSSGCVSWSNVIDPCSLFGGTSGYAEALVQIVIGGDRIGVYGMMIGGAHFEVLDRATGRTLCRFSTTCYQTRQGGTTAAMSRENH